MRMNMKLLIFGGLIVFTSVLFKADLSTGGSFQL